MPRSRIADIRRKLKSGKSIATKTSGLSSLAARVRRRNIVYDRGSTRTASVRPVTVRPLKSPSSRAPAPFMRSPPKPKMSAVGTRRRISVASAPAYRSPDASPHDIMTFIELLGTGEERVVQSAVERDVFQHARQDDSPKAGDLSLEWHHDSAHWPIV